MKYYFEEDFFPFNDHLRGLDSHWEFWLSVAVSQTTSSVLLNSIPSHKLGKYIFHTMIREIL